MTMDKYNDRDHELNRNKTSSEHLDDRRARRDLDEPNKAAHYSHSDKDLDKWEHMIGDMKI
jgi:hypothetical protein